MKSGTHGLLERKLGIIGFGIMKRISGKLPGKGDDLLLYGLSYTQWNPLSPSPSLTIFSSAPDRSISTICMERLTCRSITIDRRLKGEFATETSTCNATPNPNAISRG